MNLHLLLDYAYYFSGSVFILAFVEHLSVHGQFLAAFFWLEKDKKFI